jgi:hypothetical protein
MQNPLGHPTRQAWQNLIKSDNCDLCATLTFRGDVSADYASRTIRHLWQVIEKKLWKHNRNGRHIVRYCVQEVGADRNVHYHCALKVPTDRTSIDDLAALIASVWKDLGGQGLAGPQSQFEPINDVSAWSRYITKHVGRDSGTFFDIDLYATVPGTEHTEA